MAYHLLQGMDPNHLLAQIEADDREYEAAAAASGAPARPRRPRLLYTIPTGHNPTGVCMTLQRKRDIYRVREGARGMWQQRPYLASVGLNASCSVHRLYYRSVYQFTSWAC